MSEDGRMERELSERVEANLDKAAGTEFGYAISLPKRDEVLIGPLCIFLTTLSSPTWLPIAQRHLYDESLEGQFRLYQILEVPLALLPLRHCPFSNRPWELFPMKQLRSPRISRSWPISTML